MPKANVETSSKEADPSSASDTGIDRELYVPKRIKTVNKDRKLIKIPIDNDFLRSYSLFK